MYPLLSANKYITQKEIRQYIAFLHLGDDTCHPIKKQMLYCDQNQKNGGYFL